MKLVSYSYQGKQGYGVVSDDRIVDLAAISHEIGATLRESLERNALARIAEWSAGARAGLPLRDVDFLPVIPNPQKILCVGINYLSHMKETGREVGGAKISDDLHAIRRLASRPPASFNPACCIRQIGF